MFVLGFDADGPGTVERTVRFAREHDLFSVQFLLLTPLPGSRWAEQIAQQGRLLHRDWAQYDGHHVCFRPARVSPYELQRWQMDGHAGFYSGRQVAERLVRGRLSAALVTLYARRINYRWQRRNRAYLGELRRLSERAFPAVATPLVAPI